MFIRVRNRNTAEESYEFYDDLPAMVQDLDRPDPVYEYYYVKSTPGTITLIPVSVGNRTPSRTFELVELLANTDVVGAAEVQV